MPPKATNPTKTYKLTFETNLDAVAKELDLANRKLGELGTTIDKVNSAVSNSNLKARESVRSTAAAASAATAQVQQTGAAAAASIEKTAVSAAKSVGGAVDAIVQQNTLLVTSLKSTTDGLEKDIGKLRKRILENGTAPQIKQEFNDITRQITNTVQAFTNQLGDVGSDVAARINVAFFSSGGSLAEVLKRVNEEFQSGAITSAQAINKIDAAVVNLKKEIPELSELLLGLKDTIPTTPDLPARATQRAIPQLGTIGEKSYRAAGQVRGLPLRELGLPDPSQALQTFGNVAGGIDNTVASLSKLQKKISGNEGIFGNTSTKLIGDFAARLGDFGQRVGYDVKVVTAGIPALSAYSTAIGSVSISLATILPVALPLIAAGLALVTVYKLLSDQHERNAQTVQEELDRNEKYRQFILEGGTSAETLKKIAQLRRQANSDDDQFAKNEARRQELLAKNRGKLFMDDKDSQEFDKLYDANQKLSKSAADARIEANKYFAELQGGATATNDANNAAKQRIDQLQTEAQRQEDLRKLAQTGSEEDVKSRLKDNASRKAVLEKTISGYKEEQKQLINRKQIDSEVYQELLGNMAAAQKELEGLNKDAADTAAILPQVQYNDIVRKSIEALKDESEQRIELANIIKTSSAENAREQLAQNAVKLESDSKLRDSLAAQIADAKKNGKSTDDLQKAYDAVDAQIKENIKSTALYEKALPALLQKKVIDDRVNAIKTELDWEREKNNLIKSTASDEIKARIKEIETNRKATDSRVKELEQLASTNDNAKASLKELNDQRDKEQRELTFLKGPLTAIVAVREAENKALASVRSAIENEISTNEKVRTSSTENLKERLVGINEERAAIERRLPQLQALAGVNEEAAKASKEYQDKLTELNREQKNIQSTLLPLVKLREQEDKATEKIKESKEKLITIDEDLQKLQTDYYQDLQDKEAEFYKNEGDVRLEFIEQQQKDSKQFAENEIEQEKEHEKELAKIRKDAKDQEYDLIIERDFIGLFNLRRNTKKRIDEENAQAQEAKDKRAEEFVKQQNQATQAFAEERQKRLQAYNQAIQDAGVQYQKERGLLLQSRNQALQDIAANERIIAQVQQQAAALRAQLSQNEYSALANTSNAILGVLGSLNNGAISTVSNILGTVSRLSGLTIQMPTIIPQPTTTVTQSPIPTAGTTANQSLVYTSSSIGKAGRYLAEGGSVGKNETVGVNEPGSSLRESFSTAGRTFEFPGFGYFKPATAGYVNSNSSNAVSEKSFMINITVPPTKDTNIPRVTAAEVKRAIKEVLREG